jgi:hypothetical protein
MNSKKHLLFSFLFLKQEENITINQHQTKQGSLVGKRKSQFDPTQPQKFFKFFFFPK